MITHTFNLNNREGEVGGISEFEDSMFYRASSRTDKATYRNPVSKNHIQKREK